MTTHKTTLKTLETKSMECAAAVSFLRIKKKNSGEQGFLMEDRFSLTRMSFKNNPSLAIMPSARIGGDLDVLKSFVVSKEVASIAPAMKDIIDKDMAQLITAETYTTDTPVAINYLTVVAQDKEKIYTFNSAQTSVSMKEFVEDEVKHNKEDHEKKLQASKDNMLGIEYLDRILHILRNEPKKLNKHNKEVKVKVLASASAKNNSLAKRACEARTDGKWLDATNCTEGGANVAKHSDRPAKVFTFTGYDELERCFFTLKKDTGITSPHKNIKNVGPSYFLKKYLENHTNYQAKTMQECIDEIGAMVKRQIAQRKNVPPTLSKALPKVKTPGVVGPTLLDTTALAPTSLPIDAM